MLEEAINRILELTDPTNIKVDNKEFVKEGYEEVKDKFYQPDALVVRNLSGVVDFVKANKDQLDLGTLFLHVVSHEKVVLKSELLEEATRDRYISADITGYADGFDYGHKMNTESFIIQTQTKFVQDEKIQEVQKVVGNMSDNVEQAQSDDGVSQKITVKNGVHMLEKIDLPNPVTLKPFRTFAEIDQPESKFVLRTHSKAQEGETKVSLSEADGGFWKFDAIVNIKDYFNTKLPDISVIG